MSKFEYYGFDDRAISLMHNYLMNREQYVDFNGKTSDKQISNLGVPQGSILGPLLFLVFINDIDIVSDIISPICYADDTTLFSTLQKFNGPQIKDIQESINDELKKYNIWFKANRLTLNVKKTKAMLFSAPQKTQVNINFQINGDNIEKVNNFNYLGIIIDSHLSWKDHVCHIATKINRVNGILSRLKHILPRNILMLIYQALINSHLNYGVLTWGFNLDRITKLQKRSIRIICGAKKYNAHTEPLFKNHNILKVEDIFILKNLLLYYRIENEMIPAYFSNFINDFIYQHNHNTRRNQKYISPRFKKKMCTACVKHSMVRILNTTPDIILDKAHTTGEACFKKICKMYLLDQYKVDCQILNCYICGL